ncbi:Alpha/beta hydrolase family protein [Paenibacillus konkukensis]|uniref:Alpha/beta hydrolase family protein n=1 Tax=Paenibacillus konkukensis TaxID=2020716 RepID=A0ABY4RV65_9BACL|nr:alpha/beta hydrolase [Paenibacillus konkukensis]UQZ85898.1 Alpha/beta hydrolase family protein [Paenibacillus konkukensis]
MRPTPAITRAARPRRTLRRRTLWTAVLLVLVLAIGTVLASVYVGWQLTHPARLALSESPENYGLAFEDVQFASRTQEVNLKGWFLPSVSEPAKMNIIMAHGYRKNRLQADAEALQLAKALVEQGYNVLMFDFRNSGESEGTLTSVGYLEKYDLLGAIDWMNAQHPGKIALHGFSMGATTALTAAADEPSVAGVVADSPFNQLTAYLKENLPVWSHLPNIPFTPLILGILPPLTGIDPDQVDGLGAVDRIYPRPILFIHSVDDHSVPYRNSESLWSKHKDRFELWQVTGADHVKTHAVYPQEYEAKVIGFYDKLAEQQ